MYSNVLETKLDRHLNEIALSNSDFLRYQMEEWSISFLELRKYKQLTILNYVITYKISC